MNYEFNLNNQSFEATKTGKKKIETRVETESHPKDQFQSMEKGEIITFDNNETGEKLKSEIIRVTHYRNTVDLLDSESQEQVMSYECSREEAVTSWDIYPGYKETISKHGIWAIEIKLIS